MPQVTSTTTRGGSTSTFVHFLFCPHSDFGYGMDKSGQEWTKVDIFYDTNIIYLYHKYYVYMCYILKAVKCKTL